MSKLIKILILGGLLLLLVAPLIAIGVLSKAEIKQYQPESILPFIEKNYGEIFQVERKDITEVVTVSGTFVSDRKFFMELPKMSNPDGMRLLIDTGDEITSGQLIGYSEDLRTEIKATASGIVVNITIGNHSYITLESVDDLALSCLVNPAILEVLSRQDLALTTQQDDPVKVRAISKKLDENGKSSILLIVPNGTYGKVLKDLHLNTGRVFPQTLVVDSRCVFHLGDDRNTWYVRELDKNGNYLKNIEVEVKDISEEYVAITGVPEGTLCDSGYKKIAEGKE